MPVITVRELPDELHSWLKQQAVAHHRSLNREVIAQLEVLRAGTRPMAPASLAEIMAIAKRSAAAPTMDSRDANEIIGYDDAGLPA